MKPKKKGLPFVMLYHSVFDSEEYAALSSAARVILWLLIRRYNGRNNGLIPLGCREAATWAHCGLTTAHSALKELASSGFVTVTDKGRLDKRGLPKDECKDIREFPRRKLDGPGSRLGRRLLA